MMKRAAITTAILLACSVAHAEDKGSLGAGIMLGADGNFLESAVAFEGTLRLAPNLPLYAHAVGAIGHAGDFEGGGQFTHARGGIEARSCSAGNGGCLIGQFDAGFQSETWDGMNDFGDSEPTEDHHGMVIGPSIGVDAGGDKVRFRALVDALEFHDSFRDQWTRSVNLTVGLAIRFE